MPNSTDSKTVQTTPLSVIYISGWHLENDCNKEPHIAEQPAWLSGTGFVFAPIASNPKTEPKKVVKELDGLITAYIENRHHVGLMGHAIGGYYGAYMAEKYHLPAVLINPLVKAYDSLLLASVLEDSPKLKLAQTQLKAMELTTTWPDSLMVMLQKEDLLQDYQQARDYYQDCNQIVLNVGGHQFDNLADWVQAITCFFNRHYQ